MIIVMAASWRGPMRSIAVLACTVNIKSCSDFSYHLSALCT
jgi:hypothetical protein